MLLFLQWDFVVNIRPLAIYLGGLVATAATDKQKQSKNIIFHRKDFG